MNRRHILYFAGTAVIAVAVVIALTGGKSSGGYASRDGGPQEGIVEKTRSWFSPREREHKDRGKPDRLFKWQDEKLLEMERENLPIVGYHGIHPLAQETLGLDAQQVARVKQLMDDAQHKASAGIKSRLKFIESKQGEWVEYSAKGSPESADEIVAGLTEDLQKEISPGLAKAVVTYLARNAIYLGQHDLSFRISRRTYGENQTISDWWLKVSNGGSGSGCVREEFIKMYGIIDEIPLP